MSDARPMMPFASASSPTAPTAVGPSEMASLYLDAVRALAAIVVVLSHVRYYLLDSDPRGISWLPGTGGHEMVVVFFVLSGFVIAWSTDRKRGDWRTYASDRLSRLGSVALPALAVTALLDWAGMLRAPEVYAHEVVRDHYWARLGLAVGFLQQNWAFCTKPGSNTPFWSLAYEFWYYVAFAVICYVRGWWRAVGLAVWLAIIGWKIPLLLPVWLLGVAAYFAVKRVRLSPGIGAVLAGISGGLFVAIILEWVHLPFLVGATEWAAVPPLYFSGNFATDYFYGLLIAVHFFGMAFALQTVSAEWGRGWAGRLCRYLANRSFSLYALNVPLILFAAAIFALDRENPWQVAGATVAVFAVAFGIGGPMEDSRFAWRRWIDRFLRVERLALARKSSR